MRYDLRYIHRADDRYPFSHASSLILVSPNRMGCFWFSGSLEGHRDVEIRAAFLDRDSAHCAFAAPPWSPSGLVVDGGDLALGNPVPHLASDGRIQLYYPAFPPKTAARSELHLRESTDQGRSWGPARQLSERPGYWPRHPLLRVDGRLLLPMHYVGVRPPVCVVWRSEDEGRSWHEFIVPESGGLLQPCLVQVSPGLLHMYFRDTKCRFIHRSVSEDGGISWSRPEATAIPNNNSGLSCVRRADGSLAIAYCATQRPDRRSRIEVALSYDHGENWPDRYIVIPYHNVPASRSQTSYPFLIEDDSGTLHMSLTYRSGGIVHCCFDNELLASNRDRLAVPPAELCDRPAYDLRRLNLGQAVFMGNKKTVLSDAPEYCIGALAICPGIGDAKEVREPDQPFTVVLNRPARLVVALEGAPRKPPAWLRQFHATNETAVTSAGPFALYARNLPRGEHELGEAVNFNRHGLARWFGFLLDGRRADGIDT